MIWIPIAALFLFLAVTMLAVGLFDARDTATEHDHCDPSCPYREMETFK